MRELAGIVERLCRISEAAEQAARPGCDWPERIGIEEWCMSPELVSLHGTELYDALGPAQRRRLAFAEAVNFFSLNIHGERALIAGIAQRLHRAGGGALERYLHHFLAEENRHMALFAEFCRRYAGKIYADKKLALARAYAPGEDDFLFFARVLVFEEIVDRYNLRMSGDRRLAPIVRHINRLHHRDESRHLAFGRRLVLELFERHAPRWSGEELERARAELAAYFAVCWREYYSPEAYRDAGLEDAYGLRERLLSHPARRRHHTELSRGVVEHLCKHGILIAEPAL